MNTPLPPLPEDRVPDDLLAGEYVLGVLDAVARADVERRMATEPAFARAVAKWERQFGPWLKQVPAVDVPEHLWPRIRTRLGWAAAEPVRGVWASATFWRAATAVAAAAAIAAFYLGRAPTPAATPVPPRAVAVQPQPAPEPAARPVTVLARDDGATAWIASVAAGGDKVLMVPVPSPADPAGRVDELWIIPPGGAPLSLGFVSNEKAHTIAIPPALRHAVAVGAIFAVTLEPQAGMPHAAPSGPIVAKGQLQAI